MPGALGRKRNGLGLAAVDAKRAIDDRADLGSSLIAVAERKRARSLTDSGYRIAP